MNSSEAFTRMMDFHIWRQSRIGSLLLGAGEKANEETGWSFGTLRKAVYHLAWAEEIWLSRVNKNYSRVLKKEMDSATIMQNWKNISSSDK